MRIRKQTYSLDQYLKQMKAEVIRSDQDCQRRSGQWNANMVNELIYTVLTENYIPPIILGEETVNRITKLWLVDGLQRSSTLSLFRYGNTRVTKNLEEYTVTYQQKVLDENGNTKRDEKGEIIYESVGYDIRNKTYDQLPDELKDRFDGYQIETVIHQDCDATEISKLVRKFNNHTAMNAAQRSFTFLDAFAREIREITENRFFLDTYISNRNDRKNGTLERIVGDMVLLCCYPEQYRKDTKLAFKWLNENAAIYDFNCIDGLLTRLNAVTGGREEARQFFNSKDAHVFVAAFKGFTETGREDREFAGFLRWFMDSGNQTEIDGKTWDTICVNRSTRDTNVVRGKIGYLTALMERYFSEVKKAA